MLLLGLQQPVGHHAHIHTSKITNSPSLVKGALLCFSPVRATAGSVWSKETELGQPAAGRSHGAMGGGGKFTASESL